MKIILACDHAGFELKNQIKTYLEEKGHKIVDVGSKKLELEDSYGDYTLKGVQKVLENEENRGIFICGSGVGMCIGANRHKGIRASGFTSVKGVKSARAHNDINVICLGGRVVKIEKAIKLIETFLISPFEGGRHIPRLESLDK